MDLVESLLRNPLELGLDSKEPRRRAYGRAIVVYAATVVIVLPASRG